jgi:colanic acid/amylovoran biosynthesis glycosyltransferase
MKIALLVNDFPETSEAFILNQIVALIRLGHELDIYARQRVYPSGSERHEDLERYHLLDRTHFHPMPRPWLPRLGSAFRRMSRWGWRNPKITLESINVLRHGRLALSLTLLHELLPPIESPQRYDVIHCHFGPNGRCAVAWRDFGALRGPIITTFHGYDVNRLPRIHGSNLYQRLFKEGELFTVGSEFIKGRIIALGAPEDRIAKLPMGVDLSRFRFTERIKSHDGVLRLLTVARLQEVKGIEYALRAIAVVKDKYPNLHYQIVGDGPLRARLEELAGRLGLANNVEFLGALSQEKVVKLYQHAQIFLLPSIVARSGEEEGQSLALVEAQASGLPVIATRTGGIPESIREGKSGLLVPPQDPDALAGAIEQLVEHSQAWGRMGRAGRTHVEQHFNLEHLNDKLIDLYNTVTSRDS